MQKTWYLALAVVFVGVTTICGDEMSIKKEIKIAVGSKNPVKISAAQQAFEQLLPGFVGATIGLDVASGVSAQPMSDEESIRGARARARLALQEAKADFGVGIEGGLQKIGEHWFDTSWTVVCDAHGTEGIGASGKLMVPDNIMTLIHQGMELGHACDRVFNTSNVKQKEGFVGLMTNNVLTRTSSSAQSVVAALASYLQCNEQGRGDAS